MSTVAETMSPSGRADVRSYSRTVRQETDSSLQTKDTVGGILAAVMTLGPLAATAFIGL